MDEYAFPSNPAIFLFLFFFFYPIYLLHSLTFDRHVFSIKKRRITTKMCFRRKDEIEDALAPKPAQRPSSIDKGSRFGVGDGKKNKTSIDKPQSHLQPFASSAAGPSSGQTYAPPPGPPPPQSQYVAPYVDVTDTADYQPEQPRQPPPPQQEYHQQPPPKAAASSYADAPPTYDSSYPQHDWQAAVPDTSLFPPPPSIFSGFYVSPTSNATEEEAIAGEEWCEQYPLTPPLVLDDVSKGALHFHNIRLMEPVGFNGKLTWLGQGHWYGETAAKSPDRCIISYPPLYAVNQHDPQRTGQPWTVYYEVKLLSDSPDVLLGMGFTALPYPSFRMPGWHRGSLAVHGDDGHKYINDRWGGKAFTQPFRRGETYGIGMTFKPSPASSGETKQGDGGPDKPLVDIFFTRNGALTGGWNVHEETDAEEDLPVTGLEGLHDLCASIGTFDGVKFEAVFEPGKWLYRETGL